MSTDFVLGIFWGSLAGSLGMLVIWALVDARWQREETDRVLRIVNGFVVRPERLVRHK